MALYHSRVSLLLNHTQYTQTNTHTPHTHACLLMSPKYTLVDGICAPVSAAHALCAHSFNVVELFFFLFKIVEPKSIFLCFVCLFCCYWCWFVGLAYCSLGTSPGAAGAISIEHGKCALWPDKFFVCCKNRLSTQIMENQFIVADEYAITFSCNSE